MKTAKKALKAFFVGFGVGIGALIALIVVATAWEHGTALGILALSVCIGLMVAGIVVLVEP